MEQYELLWKNTKNLLEPTISRIVFTTYIESLQAIDLEGTTIVLKAQSELFAKGCMRVTEQIHEAFYKANTGLTDFKIYVAGSDTVFYESKPKSNELVGIPLNPNYTFDNFVVGNSNRYLYAAAKAVAEEPGVSYNPLFIYGGTGLGKTHIMQAIANHIKQIKPNLNVLYTTCEQFTNELIRTIRSGKAYTSNDNEEFRAKYRKVDVLIVDDVQFLSKKQSTQEEFFHTFNELYGNNKQIILSADCHPKDIELLEERLITRFQGGLMAQVLPPDIETKIAILQKKAENKKCILNIDVASYLAENSDDDVRSLEGLLTKVLFASLLKEEPISLKLAMETLAMSKSNDEHEDTITTQGIINAVCNYYNIKKDDLLGKKRNKEFVEPRQICIYLITELMNIPLVSVGQAMGGKDYTTIIYTRDKIADLIKNSPKTATEVNDLKNIILKK